MGKNRNKNQPQGKNMSVNDQQDQSQQASAAAAITGEATKAPEGADQTKLETSQDDGTQQGGGSEDQGEGKGAPEDLPPNPNGEGEEDQPEENSAPPTGGDADSQAPKVIDQGTQISTGTVQQLYDQAAVEIKAEPQTAAKPTEAVVSDTTAVTSDGSDLSKLLAQVEATGTNAQKSLVASLQKYMEDMKPGKPTTPAQGSMHQQRLWDIFRGVVENPDPAEFRKQMFIVRAFFKRYSNEKTAFNAHYINRFAEYWSRATQQLAALQRLINVFELTADPLTAAENVKNVDLARSLSVYWSEQHRQRVLAYFQQ